MSSGDKTPADAPEEKADPGGEISLPPELLESIPEDQRDEYLQKFGQYLLEVSREEHYAGPLQPFREAAGWDDLMPGSAERSFDLYEKQQLKRIEAQDRILTIFEEITRQDMALATQHHNDNVVLTKSEMQNNADEVKRGQWFAIVAMMVLTLGGFTMVHLGHSEVGIAAFVVEGIGAARFFLYDLRRNRSSSRMAQSSKPNTSKPSE